MEVSMRFDEWGCGSHSPCPNVSEYSSPLLHLCAVFSLSKHLLSFCDCWKVSALFCKPLVVLHAVAGHFSHILLPIEVNTGTIKPRWPLSLSDFWILISFDQYSDTTLTQTIKEPHPHFSVSVSWFSLKKTSSLQLTEQNGPRVQPRKDQLNQLWREQLC